MCHPVFYVIVTVGCPGEKGLYVVWFVIVVHLCVVSVEVVVDVVVAYDMREWRSVQSEEDGPKDGSLGDATRKMNRIRLMVFNKDRLETVGEVRGEPG